MKWISVKDRLPEVLDEVWVWVQFHATDDASGDISWLDSDGIWAMGSAKNYEVTHWMPLPVPPNYDEEEDDESL
jgi:hypothetical protein